MNTIIINGQRFNTSGNNISVTNNQVIVDGKVVQGNLSGIVEVKFEGDLASLKCNGSATVNGNVFGSVNAGGSVDCGDVGKNIDAGGSVTCGFVGGNIDAGGSVRYKK
ncbi:hypothetical protein [Paenibacillus naphthalenovorans]|uniref:Polymer-forming cytoskeletal protein n=1 Tax=Paenibacillus naphthalenovorans TaxID=162209 RepID=A0A0U2W3R3_9BACL|nr:hypothetical protein [Paenibacillus naphthalenovorans]ALS22117.1 hypothetical protein IJ22_17430 [Paenibacillus naphthalenovorans]